MMYMNKHTGNAMVETDHIRQSISDILTTPKGSRVMRREYGSLLFDLIDQAANAIGKMRLMAATVDALNRWESRIKVKRVSVEPSMSGKINIVINAKLTGSTGDLTHTVSVGAL